MFGGNSIDRDVIGPPTSAERFRDALRVFVLLIWHEDFNVRMPGVVGIAVRKKIKAALARRLDHADVLRRFAPNADGAELDVRMLDGDVGALADSDLFLQSFKREVSFVADVRHVKAMELGRGRCESDDFFSGAVAAQVVFETAGKADGAFAHTLIDEQRHFFDFRRC